MASAMAGVPASNLHPRRWWGGDGAGSRHRAHGSGQRLQPAEPPTGQIPGRAASLRGPAPSSRPRAPERRWHVGVASEMYLASGGSAHHQRLHGRQQVEPAGGPVRACVCGRTRTAAGSQGQQQAHRGPQQAHRGQLGKRCWLAPRHRWRRYRSRSSADTAEPHPGPTGPTAGHWKSVLASCDRWPPASRRPEPARLCAGAAGTGKNPAAPERPPGRVGGAGRKGPRLGGDECARRAGGQRRRRLGTAALRRTGSQAAPAPASHLPCAPARTRALQAGKSPARCSGAPAPPAVRGEDGAAGA